MGVTAENLAEKYGITREDNDNYALKTQQRWGQGGAFTEQLSCYCLFYCRPQLIQVHAGLAMLPIFSGYHIARLRLKNPAPIYSLAIKLRRKIQHQFF